MADSGLDSVDKGSPDLCPFQPKIKPSPSPPPDISPTTNNHENVRQGGIWPTRGDAVLIRYLGDGENPEIARFAAEEGLPPDQGDQDDPMKNVTILGSQAPENPNPTLKRLHDAAFRALEQDNKTGDARPDAGSSNLSKRFRLDIHDDPPSPGEVS